MFINNFKIALRGLLRRRTFSIINMMGLSLGMTAAIFVFIWVQNELSYDQYHAKASDLYRINTDLQQSTGATWRWAMVPLPLMEAIKDEIPDIKEVGYLYENKWKSSVFKNQNKTLSGKKYTYVSEAWFDLFDHQFISGTVDGFHDNLERIILTRDFAERLFGDWNVAGETFELNAKPFVVQAVIENHPLNSSFSYDFVLPMNYYLSEFESKGNIGWNNYNFLAFAEVNSTTALKPIAEKLTAIINRQDTSNNEILSLQPLSSVHFDETRSIDAMLTSNKSTVYTLGIIGFIILLLASINYVSLTTAQAGMRTKEVGVRKIIGAKGKHIFRLLFSESLLLISIALLLALSFVQLLLPFFNAFIEKNFQLDLLSPSILLVIGGILAMVLLMSGIYPAFFLTGFSPANFLKGQNFLKIKNTNFRKGLVVMQFAITISLIIAASILFQQQTYIYKKDLGYNKSHVFEFQIPYSKERTAIVNAIQQELSNSPSILKTAATNGAIINMRSTHSGSLKWEGKPADYTPTVAQFSINPDFGDLMELNLAAGRWFLPDNQLDKNNVLLNETAVKELQIPEPIIGQNFEFHGRKGQIIGVIKDFHYRNLREKIAPMVLFNHKASQGNILVKTRVGEVSAALTAAKNAWSKHQGEKPFDYQFLDDQFDVLYKKEAKTAYLFRLLSGLGLFISCLGLFGLAVFSTEQRTKEIGIRRVLGASITSIVGLLSKDFLLLILLSFFIAFPIAHYLMEGWLQNFAYRIEIGYWIFIIVGLSMLFLAFLTVSIQSIKAALANPVDTLRSE
jgi:ABC-type antimicrobial peptide transport system permease subunit